MKFTFQVCHLVQAVLSLSSINKRLTVGEAAGNAASHSFTITAHMESKQELTLPDFQTICCVGPFHEFVSKHNLLTM